MAKDDDARGSRLLHAMKVGLDARRDGGPHIIDLQGVASDENLVQKNMTIETKGASSIN